MSRRPRQQVQRSAPRVGLLGVAPGEVAVVLGIGRGPLAQHVRVAGRVPRDIGHEGLAHVRGAVLDVFPDVLRDGVQA